MWNKILDVISNTFGSWYFIWSILMSLLHQFLNFERYTQCWPNEFIMNCISGIRCDIDMVDKVWLIIAYRQHFIGYWFFSGLDYIFNIILKMPTTFVCKIFWKIFSERTHFHCWIDNFFCIYIVFCNIFESIIQLKKGYPKDALHAGLFYVLISPKASPSHTKQEITCIRTPSSSWDHYKTGL